MMHKEKPWTDFQKGMVAGVFSAAAFLLCLIIIRALLPAPAPAPVPSGLELGSDAVCINGIAYAPQADVDKASPWYGVYEVVQTVPSPKLTGEDGREIMQRAIPARCQVTAIK